MSKLNEISDMNAEKFLSRYSNLKDENLKDEFQSAYFWANSEGKESLKSLLDTHEPLKGFASELKDYMEKADAARGTVNTSPNRQFGASNQTTVRRSGGGFLREQNMFKQNEMTKEQLKLQKRAGILTESEYKAKLEKISKPLNESIGGVISLGIIGDVKDPIDYFFGKKYLNEAEEAAAVGDKVESAVEANPAIETALDKLTDEQKAQLKSLLAKKGITANSEVKDVITKIDESLFEAEGDIKQQIAGALSDVGGGLMKSMIIPLIPLIVGKVTGTGFGGGLAITAGVAGALIAIAKMLGAEKTNEVKKKTKLKEASFMDNMDDETKTLYKEYIQKIDIFGNEEIQDHTELKSSLESDSRINPRQKRILQRALGWYITQAQEMER
jgi:hypothetical protein